MALNPFPQVVYKGPVPFAAKAVVSSWGVVYTVKLKLRRGKPVKEAPPVDSMSVFLYSILGRGQVFRARIVRTVVDNVVLQNP